ncbi:phasin family protein [Actibacterium sp. MT2.3-13A]|uniref:phasin family protein n=1 Tax=Actibacterium sp. MT2.3-13A TaxID=2828332 RepID=UPI001BA923EB|nr:phasin family protein [Actibacterium sp. MT2.3-13A]
MAKKPDPTDLTNPFAAFMQAQAQAMGRMTAFNGAVAEAMGRYGQEFVGFVQDRLEEDARTQQELLACRDLTQLAEIQSRFLERAMQQYTDETGKLVDLGREMFDQAVRQAKG